MATVGLAAQLAKQAAQAAREEVMQSEAQSGTGKAAGGKSAASVSWNVPVLPDGFDLSDAMVQATHHVMSYYQQALKPEGIQVNMEAASPAVAQVQQPEAGDALEPTVTVRESETGRLVRAYTRPDLLTMFATQRQVTGVVVDGQV